MSAWTYGVTTAAVCAAILVIPADAASPAGPQQEQAPPAQAQRRAQAPEQAPPPPAQKVQRGGWDTMGMRGFSVALVLGDLAGAATPDNLPAGAKRALSDMRDFLPYKSYRLLDTHWILCCSSSMSSAVSGRLRGAEDDEYAFDIDVRPASDWSELAVRFNLRETAGPDGAAHADLVRERAELERRLTEMRSIGRKEEHPEMTKLKEQLEASRQRLAELETFERARATTLPRSTKRSTSPDVLNSSFSMKVGETVVIGTSRLKGDKALIALLTAASRNSAPSEKR